MLNRLVFAALTPVQTCDRRGRAELLSWFNKPFHANCGINILIGPFTTDADAVTGTRHGASIHTG